MTPDEVSKVLRQIAVAIENSSSPRQDLVTRDLRRIVANLGRMAERGGGRSKFIFPAGSQHVKDGSDHFPYGDEAHGRAALSEANKYDKAPSWFDGPLSKLVDIVVSKVHGEYPDMEISEESGKPGKG